MTLLWFGIIIFGIAGLLWLIDWLFDRGEVDPPPQIDGVPVDTIHADLWPVPVVGESWYFFAEKRKGDPFPDKLPPTYARILEVRDGWVRYTIGNIFPDERLAIGDFTRMYSRVSDIPNADFARQWEAQQNDPEAINRQANLMQQARCAECGEPTNGEHKPTCSYPTWLAKAMQAMPSPWELAHHKALAAAQVRGFVGSQDKWQARRTAQGNYNRLLSHVAEQVALADIGISPEAGSVTPRTLAQHPTCYEAFLEEESNQERDRR